MSKKESQCCKVDAIVSFDERGQLVIPKELRLKYNLQAGDKFALISCDDKQGLCCFTLIKADKLQGMVQSFLGPVFSNMFGK